MKRLREILLTQYIGAITIGFILAQAAIGFVSEITQTVAGYWVLQSQRSALGPSTSFPWANFLTSMVSIALNLVVGFLLIRWLYAEEKGADGTTGESEV